GNGCPDHDSFSVRSPSAICFLSRLCKYAGEMYAKTFKRLPKIDLSHIHLQLAKEAIVTESKLLRYRAANVDREIDLVIEKQVGDYTITIGIECQGRGRVANVEWVEQMITKHQTLSTNKLILVSKSGFTE